MNKKIITTGIVALIIGIGIGYFGSSAFASPSASPTARRNFAGLGGAATSSTFAFGGRGGLVSGSIATKDSQSITVDTKDGSSHIILITPATTILESVVGTSDDLSVGGTVVVTGTANSDGSITASSIQVRPAATGQ